MQSQLSTVLAGKASRPERLGDQVKMIELYGEK